MSARLKAWQAVAASVALLATGCSLGDDAPDEPLTLSGAVGLGPSPFATDSETIDAADDAIVECMMEQGWEYIPYNLAGPSLPVLTDEDREAMIEQQGMGIVINYLTGGQGFSSGEDEDVDPNAAYLETLTEDERAAWTEALWGEPGDMDAEQEVKTAFDPSTGGEMSIVGNASGCYKRGYDMIYANFGQSDAVVASLRSLWEGLQAEIEADPRTAALDDDWAACMSDAGYSYEDKEEFQSSSYMELTEKADAIVGPDYTLNPMEGWSDQEVADFFNTATPEEIDALYDEAPSKLSADQKTRLQALFELEVDMALAEHACTVANRPRAEAIASEVEERYVAEHQTELTALAATMAEEE